MKQNLLWSSVRPTYTFLLFISISLVCITGCRKDPGPRGELPPVAYSADVLDKWMTLEIRLYSNVTGIFNGGVARPFAYSGICAYESIDPGFASWKNKYNGLSSLPETDKSKKYHWPLSVNASLAEFNRQFFTSANSKPADIAAIDSLEGAINASFSSVNPAEASRSIAFGKAIADAIFAWSTTDDYDVNNALPYTPPVGFGLWELAPPAFAKPQGPYWSHDRRIIASSGDNAGAPPPTPYSEDPNSDFYKMVNDLYAASLTLTTDQKNWALFWRDIPGTTTPGHWLSIVQQVVRQTHSRLDRAALAYAMVGIELNDGVISVFGDKYKYNVVRPITYIRKVIGDAAWLSFLTTPSHPEYPSAHSVVSAAASEALMAIYGNIGPFTDHTFDYLGIPARTFKTLRDIGQDAGHSRFYAGIHYKPSIEAGLTEGRIIGENIVNELARFHDDDK